MENPFRSDTKVSTMRICMFMCVLSAVVLVIGTVVLMALNFKIDLLGVAAIIGALLAGAFGGKVGQELAGKE
jgi:hypothetical protein